MKYIVVTGGVNSGIGKGIVASSIGALLKACELTVTTIKIDPYFNVDAGTFSPYEHGEVFVLSDGSETDLDLGNYERFLDIELQGDNNITTGKIHSQVINRERQGDYLGKTVRMIPHITDAIQEWIEKTSRGNDSTTQPEICIIELGGTVGDIEGQSFIFALRRLAKRVGRDNFFCCHVTYLPLLVNHELKTKPTQRSVEDLNKYGLYPDLIVCRSQVPMTEAIKQKISESCGVDDNCVFSLPDLKTIYQVPIELHKQGIIRSLSHCLYGTKIDICPCDGLRRWQEISDIAINATEEVIIALVGKYTALGDCYTSVVKALEHACYNMHAKPKIRFIDAEKLEVESEDSQAWVDLKTSDCLIVPGGFGIRGVEGKIAAIKWARENKHPFLGICLGFQMAAVEYARNVLMIDDAHSGEFAADLDKLQPIVIEMLEYKDPEQKMGGTMRLGLRKTKFVVDNSILRKLYDDKDVIEERHRHRYEINNDFIEPLEKVGLRFVGKNDDETRMEILELDTDVHPFFVAVQYHPEYTSRPFRPSPPYKGLVEAGRNHRQNR